MKLGNNWLKQWLVGSKPLSEQMLTCTLGTKPSVNIFYKTTFFLSKISESIYILPIWLSTVINQIVNKVYIRIKTTPPYESHFLYLTKKRHIQTQARQDKAWQGMARQGQARPDEARRGGAQTKRCPLVLKNTVLMCPFGKKCQRNVRKTTIYTQRNIFEKFCKWWPFCRCLSALPMVIIML